MRCKNAFVKEGGCCYRRRRKTFSISRCRQFQMCLSYLSSAREEMEKHEKRCQLGEGKKKKKGKARALSNILQSWILIVFSVVIWKRDMMWHSLFNWHLTFFVQCSSWGKQTRGDLKKETFFWLPFWDLPLQHRSSEWTWDCFLNMRAMQFLFATRIAE